MKHVWRSTLLPSAMTAILSAALLLSPSLAAAQSSAKPAAGHSGHAGMAGNAPLPAHGMDDPWNGAFISMADHSSGAGSMYVGNGSPTGGAVVWQSSAIAVSASTDYFFEAWVANVCCTAGYVGDNSASVLEFSINGLTVGTRSTNLNKAGTWEGLSTTWNSGAAATAVLQLINRNTAAGGNDFAIDDISLSTESTVSPVPEPTTLVLLLSGSMVVGAAVRRRKPTR